MPEAERAKIKAEIILDWTSTAGERDAAARSKEIQDKFPLYSWQDFDPIEGVFKNTPMLLTSTVAVGNS